MGGSGEWAERQGARAPGRVGEKRVAGAARRLQVGRPERSQRLGVPGWAVAATRGSGYSLSLVCRRRLAVVDVPVWQGVGHRGALRGPGGKVLQQISKAKRRGGEHHRPHPSLGITRQQVAADAGTGLPPRLFGLGGGRWGGRRGAPGSHPPVPVPAAENTPSLRPPPSPPIQASWRW